MTVRGNRLAVAVLLAVTVVAGCATGRGAEIAGTPRGPEPSPTLGPSIHYEEGKLVFFAVNAHMARFSLEKELIPLEIAIANKGLKTLTVYPERITLRAPGAGGKAWPMASPQESVARSLRSSFDRKLSPVSFVDLVRRRFPAFTYVPSTFGFRGGNWTMTRSAEMARNTWTLSQVFFPNPGGELKGKVFEVWLEAEELPDPVFTTIRF